MFSDFEFLRVTNHISGKRKKKKESKFHNFCLLYILYLKHIK